MATESQLLVVALVEAHPVLTHLLDDHVAEFEGELLPYLVLADIARWAQSTYPLDPQAVGEVVDWLEEQFDAVAATEQNLIALGFVEEVPYPPEGAPLLLRLGPTLTRVAHEIGILPGPG